MKAVILDHYGKKSRHMKSFHSLSKNSKCLDQEVFVSCSGSPRISRVGRQWAHYRQARSEESVVLRGLRKHTAEVGAKLIL
jgi:hypothetical protein